MHSYVALVEMRIHRTACRLKVVQAFVAGAVNMLGVDIALREHNIDRRALRLVILLGNIENRSAYPLGNGAENTRKSFGVVLLVDIRDIVLLFPLTFCIAHVVNIEAKRFCEVVKAIQSQLFFQP